MDGFEFLAKLREHDTQTPVLMLSARDSPVDVAKGLRYGADDYVRKPFSLEEILLRITAILRRSNAESTDDLVLVSGPIEMNVDTHEITGRRRTGHALGDRVPAPRGTARAKGPPGHARVVAA